MSDVLNNGVPLKKNIVSFYNLGLFVPGAASVMWRTSRSAAIGASILVLLCSLSSHLLFKLPEAS